MSFKRLTWDDDTMARLRDLGPEETIPVIGRCPEKRCREGVRLELGGIVVLDPDDPAYPYGFGRRTSNEQWQGAGQWQVDRIEADGFTLPEGSRFMYATGFADKLGERYRCPIHFGGFQFAGLRSITVSTAACGLDCEQATGSECKCSCGGANHGIQAGAA